MKEGTSGCRYQHMPAHLLSCCPEHCKNVKIRCL
jgi:hypothetical protein